MKTKQLHQQHNTLAILLVYLVLAHLLPIPFLLGQESGNRSGRSATAIKPIKTEKNTERVGSQGLASPQVVSRALAMIPGNDPVLKETELLDYQLDQIKEIRYGLQKRLGKAARETAKLSGAEKRKYFDQVYRQTHDELQEALLPKQFTRLLQISLQSFGISKLTGEADLANLIGHPVVQSELHLPAAKIKQIREKMLEENKRVAAEIERIKAEARKNVLSVLDASEREQLESLVGEPFDFQGFQPGRGGKFSKPDDDH